MTTVAITINEEHQRFIDESVAAGSFITKSEVVATALEILKSRETVRRERRAALKREIDKGLADIENGRVTEFDLDTFIADMKAKRAAQV